MTNHERFHERFHERCQDFLKATERLAEACAQPYSEFLRDSVIQRFEFCWELAWKVLRLKLLEEGIEALTPREVFREALAARGITACIPSKSNRKAPIEHDRVLYRQRHMIENMFGRLKDWRRIHTRYDRCAHTFMSAICIAASVIFWL